MQRSGGSWFKASHETLSQKHLHKNKAGAVAQGVGPEFKPQYHKKKKSMQTSILLQVLLPNSVN
jgi:hypothetical protein